MLKDKLSVGFVSDIHLFHPRTKTRVITKELKEQFNSSLTDLDILFFGGDVFDRVSTLPKEVVTDAEDFIFYILRWAVKTDTQIRILEGTPSHDWKQSRWFIRINELANIGADVEYYPELAIEHNERYGIDVLYVPDEWEAETSETLLQVKKLMANRGIDKLDLAIMHGQFNYQLPEIARAPKHDEQEYLNLVRYYISIGHVHTHSVYDRIIAQGSFSRLSHGEEEKKGWVRANLYKDGRCDYEFIENKSATRYIDIDITKLRSEEAFKKIDKVLSKLEDGDHVRVVLENTHPMLKELDVLIRKYPTFRWSNKTITANDKSLDESLLFERGEFITLTKENVVSQLLNRLLSKKYQTDIIDNVEKLFTEIVNEHDK